MKLNIYNRAGRASALPAILVLLMLLLCAPCHAGAATAIADLGDHPAEARIPSAADAFIDPTEPAPHILSQPGDDASAPVTVCILDSGCNGHDGAGESFLGTDARTDAVGHGTRICSLVREGAPEANVVMLQCFDAQETVNEAAIVAALYAAVDTWHADVINMSWTLADESEALHEAIRHAHDSGAVLVACAGNLSLATGLGTVACPAAWDEVIGVAGVDLTDAGEPKTSLWYLYGEAVDFCARGDCGDEKGASYATARVSGLIAAALQGGVEPVQLPEYLASLAQDMGEPGFDDRYGWGYLETP